MSSRALANHIVQVSTDAKARPIITAFTTISAAMNIPHGERSRGSLSAMSGAFAAWAAAGESTADGVTAGVAAGAAGAACSTAGDGGAAAGDVCARTGAGRIRTAATMAAMVARYWRRLMVIECTILSAFQSLAHDHSAGRRRGLAPLPASSLRSERLRSHMMMPV